MSFSPFLFSSVLLAYKRPVMGVSSRYQAVTSAQNVFSHNRLFFADLFSTVLAIIIGGVLHNPGPEWQGKGRVLSASRF